MLRQIKVYADWLKDRPWLPFWVLFSCLLTNIHNSQLYYKHDAPKWWLLDIGLSIFVAIRALTIREVAFGSKTYLSIGFLILCGLSVFWAPNKGAAVELFLRYSLFAGALFFLVRDASTRQYESLPFIVSIFSASSFFVVHIFERYIFGLPYSSGAYTPLGFINHAGHIYIIWMPILFWGTLIYKGWVRYLCVILFLLSSVILLESAIRASIFGLLAAGLLVTAIFLFKRKTLTWQPLVLLCVFFTMIFLVKTFHDSNKYLSKKLVRTTNFSNINSASSNRLTLFKNTLAMIGDSPFGVGLNNFEYIHPLYAKPGSSAGSPFVGANRVLRTPHNFLLKTYSEVGWLGGTAIFILGTWALVTSVFGVLRYCVKPAGKVRRWAPAYCIALGATLFNAMFSAVFSNPGSLWFSLFLLAGVGGLSLPHLKTGMAAFNSEIARWLIALTVFVFIGLSCASIVSQRLAYQGKSEYDLLKLERAVKISPYNERALYDYAVMTFEQGRNTSKAIELMQKFLTMYPYHIGGRFKLSQWLYQQQKFLLCKAELEKILRYYPTFKAAKNLYKQASVKSK